MADLPEQGILGEPLPIDFGPDLPRRICWYCGGGEERFETEHQLPISRGGGAEDNIVEACASCNSLKGPLTLEEFRQALVIRLGLPTVVFAGEANATTPATPIRSIRSLGADREVVRIDPVVGDRLTRAVRFLRTLGRTSLTAKAAATEAIDRWCDDAASKHLDPGKDFPADGGMPTLFEDAEVERSVILRPGELSSTPRVTQSREVTRISGPVLDRARQAVGVLRQNEDPELSLTNFVDAAVLRLTDDVEDRYPGIRV